MSFLNFKPSKTWGKLVPKQIVSWLIVALVGGYFLPYAIARTFFIVPILGAYFSFKQKKSDLFGVNLGISITLADRLLVTYILNKRI